MSESGGQPPVYGPVHRRGAPPVELRDGPPRPPTPPPLVPVPTAPPYAAWSPVAWGPAPPWSAPLRHDYAPWGRRVAAAVIDAVPGWVAVGVLVAGYLPTYRGFFRGDLSVSPRYPLVVVGILLYLVAFGLAVYNRYFLAGRTGQTFGKRVLKIWLVGRATARPIGPFNAFIRDLLHTLDGIAYVGYLWPLWDDERQTLADKIAETVVVRTPVPPLTELERWRG